MMMMIIIGRYKQHNNLNAKFICLNAVSNLAQCSHVLPSRSINQE
jgi:hypothetical protein